MLFTDSYFIEKRGETFLFILILKDLFYTLMEI